MKTEDRYTIDKLQHIYHEFMADCAYEPDMMSDEDTKIRKVKYVICRRIPAADRALIVLYAECCSLRKLAEYMDVSHVTIKNRIARIRKDILSELERLKDKDV